MMDKKKNLRAASFDEAGDTDDAPLMMDEKKYLEVASFEEGDTDDALEAEDRELLCRFCPDDWW